MIRRLFLELKNIKGYYVIPIIIVWFIVPLVVVSEMIVCGAESLQPLIKLYKTGQELIAWFSIIWPVFVMKEYLNSPGKELLFVYRYGCDTILTRMVFLWGWYVIHLAILLAVFQLLFYDVLSFFLLTAAQCLFLVSLTYQLAMLSRNTFLPLIVTFSYCLALIYIAHIPAFSIFIYDPKPFDPGFTSKSLSVCIPALILLGGGYAAEIGLYKTRI